MKKLTTVFDALVREVLRAANFNPHYQKSPAVVLWTDKEKQWEPLLPRLREALPQFLTLGVYKPEIKVGPAIWLRCMVARTLPAADWSENVTPIIYLPGVSRQELRTVADCPEYLKPLVELQYRGIFWTQVNARDWTLAAFLQSKDGGLGLDLALDKGTLQAMRRSLLKLADVTVTDLQGKKLQTQDFNQLINPDPVLKVLQWLDDPDGVCERSDENEWLTFCNVCREKFSFDPRTDGTLVAGEYLGQRVGNWNDVWGRYSEAPGRYQVIPEILRQVKPGDMDNLFCDRSAWPQENELMENDLRRGLLSLDDKTPGEVRNILESLELRHGLRRQWVWAALGWSPLARTLIPLLELASCTKKNLSGINLEELAENYVSEGWKADAAALDALAMVLAAADVEAVKTAIVAVYKSWLEDGAYHFQDLAVNNYLPVYRQTHKLGETSEGCCLLFVDGLRLDIAKKLTKVLSCKGLQVDEDWTFTALPSVTATSKSAISPIASLLGPGQEVSAFVPGILGKDKSLNAMRFRQLLAAQGYEVFAQDELGSADRPGWTEYGNLDDYGHKFEWKLAQIIEGEINGLVDRILTLFSAGWKEIRIITDHGWLLLPGGLPKVELPACLATERWGRCAALKENINVEMPTVPWHWNSEMKVAMAPGIACFFAGKEYAHGSLSLQECVIPILNVRSLNEPLPKVSIEKVKWIGFRCKVEVAGGSGLVVDLRTKINDATSSIVDSIKTISLDGSASLTVVNDDLDGMAVTVVVLSDSKPIAKYSTLVGG